MWCSTLVCIVTFILSLLVAPLAAEAQPEGKIPRLGILTPGIPPQPWVDAFRQGLHALGYVEGQTVALEVRWDEYDRAARARSSSRQLGPAAPAPSGPWSGGVRGRLRGGPPGAGPSADPLAEPPVQCTPGSAGGVGAGEPPADDNWHAGVCQSRG